MTRSRPPSPPATVQVGPSRWAATAQTALLVALLALTAARTTLGESPFKRSPLAEAGAFEILGPSAQIQMSSEVARIAAAVAIAILAAGWAVIGAIQGRLEICRPWLAVLVIALAACLFASAAGAADKREALTTAAEQTALVLSAFLAIQLARAPWQRRLVLIVLAGLAGLQGAKGLYQVWVEIPDTISYHSQIDPRYLLARQQDDSPEQRLFEARLFERTTKGYFVLANVYGSLMILLTLAAAGLAADKWFAWRAQRQAARTEPARGPPGRPGQISTAFLAALLTMLLVAPAAASLWLTESKGAIAAGVLAAVAAVVLYLARHWAARHRRALAAGALAVLAAGIAATVAYGIHRGGLPSRSLQVRWEYWVGAMDVVRERPLLGAGPGNFPDAYLPCRPAGAEESVKNPHNVIVQALSEYGLLGGGVYLALLLWTLLGLAGRPAEADGDSSAPARAITAASMLLAIAAGAVGWRLALTGYPFAIVGIFENVMVLCFFVTALFVAAWTGGRLADGLAGGLGAAGAIALGCGLAGFALHNLSDFALFQPGAAMVFWVAAGAMLAGKLGRTWQARRIPAAVAALALGTAAILLTIAMLIPVERKTAAVLEAAEAYMPHQLSPAIEPAIAALQRAAQADPLDAGPLADQAQLLQSQAEYAQYRETLDVARTLLDRAADAASLAAQRQPCRASYRQERLELRVLGREPTLLWGRWHEPPPDLPDRRRWADEHLAEHPCAPMLNAAAQYAFQAGDYAAAADYLARATRVADWPILLDHLGDACHARGDRPAAEVFWRQFQQSRRERFTLMDPSFAEAVAQLRAMDPQNLRMHLELAELAWQAGQIELIGPLLDAALAADAALWPASVMRLTERELAHISLLRAKRAAAE